MPKRELGQKLSDFIGRFVPIKREKKKPERKPMVVGYSEAKQMAKEKR